MHIELAFQRQYPDVRILTCRMYHCFVVNVVEILLILARHIRLSICHMTESGCVEFKCPLAFSVLEALCRFTA